jgi:hypothetical protein
MDHCICIQHDRGCLGPLTVWVTKPNDEDEADDDVPMDSVAHGARANRDGDRRSVHYNLRDRTYGAASSVKRGKMIMMPRYWDKIYEKTHEYVHPSLPNDYFHAPVSDEMLLMCVCSHTPIFLSS